MNQTAEQKTQSDLKPLYTRSVVNALGTGMVSPFMGAYAVKLGAASSEMGWFQSSSNLSNNVTQIFWGRLSDKLQRRVPFIIIGSLIIAALWLPMIFVTDATQLIVLLAIQALLGSMAVPAWTALIGDMVPSRELGRANASVYLWTSVGSLIATLASGIIMIIIGGSLHEMFLIPLLVATVCGAASSMIMIGVKERKYKNENHASTKRFTWELIGIDVLARARKTPEFVRFLYAESLFQFFMSISWPLFSITQIRILNASMLQIALLTIVQTFFTIIFQGWAGRLADTRGRKPLLFFFRASLITVPIAYALSPDVNTLILISAFWGLSQAVGQASLTAYLLDISPEEYRGSFAAAFNLIIGILTFFGSLIGGYLSDYVIAIFGLTTGLQIVYLISTIGRGAGAAAFLTLKETLRKPA